MTTKPILSFVSTLLLAVLFLACDPCRNLDLAAGNSGIEIVFVDSNFVNVFETRFDLSDVVLIKEDGLNEEVGLSMDSNAIIFYFDDAYVRETAFSDDYTIRFDSATVRTFTMNYKSSEVGECGGWRYDYVNVEYEGIAHVRERDYTSVQIVF